MENDHKNKYRDLLEEHEPDFQNRVDTPWDVNIPDEITHNDSSYKSIERQLRRLTKKTNVNQHAPLN